MDVALVSTPDLDVRVRMFRCGTIVYTFALLAERNTIVVDTMVSPETMAVACETLLAEGVAAPWLVVNTHGDWDHVWGNGLFTGPGARYPAPIVGAIASAEAMRSPDTEEWLQTFKERNPGEYDDARFVPPTLQFGGPFRIDAGDMTLEFIPTPGHTADHHAIWIPELRLLIAGDAAESPMPFVYQPQSVPVIRESLRRMKDLGPKRVLYCHAGGRTDPGVIDANIAYFDEAEARTRAAQEKGVTFGPDVDGPTAIGWPLEAALPQGLTIEDLPNPDFYRRAHRLAVENVAAWLRRPMSGLGEA